MSTVTFQTNKGTFTAELYANEAPARARGLRARP